MRGMVWWGARAGKNTSRRVAVIGQQVADARAAEERHREWAGDAVSPLEGVRYRRGEHDLLRFKESDTDATIAAVARRFEEDPEREQLRSAMTDRDFYTLMSFASRSAVSALKTGNFEVARQGFTALAMIDSDRVDFRDLLVSASIARYVMGRVEKAGEANGAVTRAVDLADPVTARHLRRFRKFKDRDLEKDWRMTEVQTPDLIGLVSIGGRRLTGNHDLVGASLRLMDLVDEDKYSADGPQVGEDVSPNWFPRNSAKEIERLLARARGIVSFHGRLRREHAGPDATPFDHMFLAFVIETANAKDAKRFEQLWAAATRTFATLVVRHERLLMLVIARSVVHGKPPIETDQTLARFADPSRQILETTQ
jgi:hypothetical protein